MKTTSRTPTVAALLLGLGLGLPAVAGAETVKLYKNAECSCCDNYTTYLRANGFEVEVIATEDLVERSEALGIPAELQGCHTAIHQGRVVSGHVPVESLRAFLKQAPEGAALTLPGMPAGSPGMGGEADGPLRPVIIPKSGKPAYFDVTTAR